MNCHKCGSKLAKRARFCPKCGEPVLHSVTTAPQEPKKEARPLDQEAEAKEQPQGPAQKSLATTWAQQLEGAAPKTSSTNGSKVFLAVMVGLVVGIGAIVLYEAVSPSASSSGVSGNATTTTFYTTASVNVRSCGDTDCTILGTYPANTPFDLAYTSETLPAWVEVPVASGSSQNGFMDSALLAASSQTSSNDGTASQNTSTGNQQSQSTPSGASASGLSSSLINQIEPSIVEINCYPSDVSTSGEYIQGSGVSVNYGGTTYIETNYHVYNEANTGGGPPTCYAVYPQAPDFLYNPDYGDYQLTLYGSHYDPDTYEDVADFTLGAPFNSSSALSSIPTINDTSLTGIGSGCSDVNVGDNVTIFGYPASGDALETSETVTQGTIAGIITGPIYKFDGAIDHGNSGGLAVLDKDGCDLGIPTLGVSGLTAGIGYIQSVSLARQAVTETGYQSCEDNVPNSTWNGTVLSDGSYDCICNAGYTPSGGQCVAQPTGYQSCEENVPNSTWEGGYLSDGGYDCICDSGYTASGGQCVAEPSGYQVCEDDFPNSTWEGGYLSDGGYDCVCNYGYVGNGSQCVAEPSCTAYSTYDTTTGECECDSGYSPVDGTCESDYTYCEEYGEVYNGSQCVEDSY